MTFRQFLTVLKARKLVVLVVPIVAAVAAAGASALLPTRWTASTTVLVDTSSPASFTGNPPPAQADPGPIATQVEIIRSRNVALKVVDKLKLHDSAEAQREWRQATEGRGSLKAWLADRLLGNLAVSPARESSVIGIDFSASDAQFAASAANAFARSYVETNLELKLESARLAAQWQAERARALSQDAQPSLEGPATRTNVIVLSPAVEPVKPSFPNWPLNIAVAVCVGALLGVGTALVMESLDQRVRSEGDVSDTLEVPLLATLPHARSPRRVQTRLVDQRPAPAGGGR